MILPLATRDDLLDELQMVDHMLARMDAAVIVNRERWENRREGLRDHRADVLHQLDAGLAAVSPSLHTHAEQESAASCASDGEADR